MTRAEDWERQRQWTASGGWLSAKLSRSGCTRPTRTTSCANCSGYAAAWREKLRGKCGLAA